MSLARDAAAAVPAIERLGRRLQRLNYAIEARPQTHDIAGQPIRTYDLVRPVTESMTEWLIDAVAPGDTVVDIGANVGVYACALANLGADVHAVEPNPVTVGRLVANVACNAAERVDVYTSAIADRDGSATLYCSSNHRRSSLDATAARAGGNAVTREVEVPCRSLDSLLEAVGDVDHVKIDVEGAERAVVASGSQQLADERPTLWIETHQRDRDRLLALLDALEYGVEERGRFLVCSNP